MVSKQKSRFDPIEQYHSTAWNIMNSKITLELVTTVSSGNHFHFKEGFPGQHPHGEDGVGDCLSKREYQLTVMETRPYQRIMVINNRLNKALFLGVALGDPLRFSRKKGNS